MWLEQYFLGFFVCLYLLLLLYSIKSLFNNILGWTRTCCVVQAYPDLVVFLLSPPPLCWNYMCELPQLAWSCIKLWPSSPACFPACTWPHPASLVSSYPQGIFLARGLTLLLPSSGRTRTNSLQQRVSLLWASPPFSISRTLLSVLWRSWAVC